MELKALEILKNHIVDLQDMANIFDEYSMYKTKNETIKAISEINEVIIELELLNNRSCSNCKYFNENGAYYGICKKDVNTTKNQDEFLSNVEFYCNRWEQK